MTAIADSVHNHNATASSASARLKSNVAKSLRPMARLDGPDDLTTLEGIGMTAENRLYRAGIRSFADLAASTPERLKKIMGAPRPGISYENLIASAQKHAN